MRFLPRSVSHLILVYLAVFRPALKFFAMEKMSPVESYNYDHYLFISHGKILKSEHFATVFQHLTSLEGFTLKGYRDSFAFLVKYDHLLKIEQVNNLDDLC